MSVLSARDLRITYHTSAGGVPAVRGVDLTIDRGEVLGLAGESGCGKSTIAAAILRLLPPRTLIEGEILLNGENILEMKPGHLRTVRWTGASIIFQGAMHALNPVKRVGQQIAEAITTHHQAGDKEALVRVGQLLEQVGLPPRRIDDYPHELSGGQKQRVMIAMALACNPSLIIADEPTTALDVMVQAQVLALLKELQHELGLAMLFITHDLSVLVEVSDRLAIMYAGKIVEDGPAQEVFYDSKHPYTKALAGAFPEIGDQTFRRAPSGLGGRPAGSPADPPRVPLPSSVPRGVRALSDRRTQAVPRGRGPPGGLSPGRGRAGGRARGPGMSTPDRKVAHVAYDEPPVLELRELGVNFAGRVGLIAGLLGRKAADARAVDGVDLTLHRGEVLALAGESGCGKTTTARAIMGLLKPDRGSILFEGEPLGRNLREYRRRVQMVFQDPTGSLNPRQTIYEIVAEGLRIHRITRGPNGESEEQLVARALSRAGLRPPERFFLLYPHELSGGQRQRVVIAGALALDPEVIVADEPVSNLDASVRGEILRLLLKLRDELRISILIVTHDLGLAWTVADRVAVMYLGRIVEVGPAEDVLTQPLHPYTQALLDVVPEAGGIDRPILQGEPPDPTRVPPGCRFHPRCPQVADGRASAAGLEDRCRNDDVGLSELQPGRFAACHLAAFDASQAGSGPRSGSGAPQGESEPMNA